MLDIGDREKKVIGLIVNQVRLNLRETSDGFNIEEFIEGICSKETYNKLSKGRIVKESEIYDELLFRLNLKYNYDFNFNEMIEPIALDICHTIDQGEFIEAESKIDELLNLSEEHIRDPYGYALNNTLTMVYPLLNRVSTISQGDMNEILDYAKLLPSSCKDFIGYYVARYIYNFDGSRKNVSLVEECFSISSSNLLCNNDVYLNLLILNKDYYDAAIYCNECLEELKLRSNQYQLFQFKLTQCMLMLRIQPNRVENIISEIDQELEINEFQHAQLHHMIGLFYYESKDDKEMSYTYFVEASKNNTFVFPEYILLHHLNTLYNLDVPENLKEVNNIEDYEETWRDFYKYYHMKESGSSTNELEDYVLSVGKDISKKMYPSQLAANIFKDELSYLTELSGNKNKLYKFVKSVKNL